MVALIIQLVSGVIGGNVAGTAVKSLDMGVLRNSIAGLVGGGIGSVLLSGLGIGASSGILGQISSGGVGGLIIMAVAGALYNILGKSN
jgi:uncharacterized membrane protein YeaQ/YmgE (transglycosylase-associated protein family)